MQPHCVGVILKKESLSVPTCATNCDKNTLLLYAVHIVYFNRIEYDACAAVPIVFRLKKITGTYIPCKSIAHRPYYNKTFIKNKLFTRSTGAHAIQEVLLQ